MIALGNDIPFLSCTGQYKNIILDIGGVLLASNLDAATHGTSVPLAYFKRMLRSHTWFMYQEGRLSEEECYHQLSLDTGYAEQDLRTLIRNARGALSPITEMIGLVERLRGKLRLFCMTNAPKEEWECVLAAFPDVFQNFERVFFSAAAGMRKPYLSFYTYVLEEAGIQSSETIFVDDELQNTMAAAALGITAICADTENVGDTVKQLVYTLRTQEERLLAARDYLYRTKGVNKSLSLTNEGLRVPIHFDHYIIAMLLNDESFLPISQAPASGTLNFFPPEERQRAKSREMAAFTHVNYPDEIDSTGNGLSALYKFSKVDMKTINATLDTMIELCINSDGLLQTYFDPRRPRVEPIGQMNACYLFHLAGRLEPVKKTEDFLFKLLSARAYVRGTCYYLSGDHFLFHFARLVHDFKDHFEAKQVDLLAMRVKERVGMEGDALALAMRVRACDLCGIPNSRDRRRLASMQGVDGSWDPCHYYTYSDPKTTWWGNEALTTAFALTALANRSTPPEIID
jgi:HAD superfamily hydrolase (TIGR01509 family)